MLPPLRQGGLAECCYDVGISKVVSQHTELEHTPKPLPTGLWRDSFLTWLWGLPGVCKKRVCLEPFLEVLEVGGLAQASMTENLYPYRVGPMSCCKYQPPCFNIFNIKSEAGREGVICCFLKDGHRPTFAIWKKPLEWDVTSSFDIRFFCFQWCPFLVQGIGPCSGYDVGGSGQNCWRPSKCDLAVILGFLFLQSTAVCIFDFGPRFQRQILCPQWDFRNCVYINVASYEIYTFEDSHSGSFQKSSAGFRQAIRSRKQLPCCSSTVIACPIPKWAYKGTEVLCWQQSTWIAWHSHIKLKWLDSWFQGSHDASVWEGRGQVGAGKRVDVAVFWKGTEDASCAKCHPFLAVRRWSVANEKRSELSASPSLSLSLNVCYDEFVPHICGISQC